MAKGKFISYLRVSTQRQGKSGLGVEAQREAVANYLNGDKWELIEEVIEVESGRRSDRPELERALRLCRLHKATLLVAKLDRLARNVAFVAKLMESGAKFQAVDMPDVNEMVVHILVSVAQGEAKAIEDRTKAALAAAKARGTKLGGYRWNIGSIAKRGNAASIKVRRAKASRHAEDVRMEIDEIKRAGATTLRTIAAELSARNILTPRQSTTWSAAQVRRILKCA